MKATKLLAVLLAILMVIPAMVFPTAAEKANAAAESNVTEYRFTTLAESEALYLNPNYPGRTNENGRYGEGGGMRYEFPLTSDTMPTNVSIAGYIYNDVYFKVSFDGINFFDAYKASARVAGGAHSFDLDENGELAKAWDAAWMRTGKTPTTMYLHVDNVYFEHMTSNESATGWGTFIANNMETVVTIESDPIAPQTKYWSTVFTPGTDDGSYVYQNNATGVNNSCYYLDENAGNAGGTMVMYAYAMTNSELPEKLTWTASVGQKINLEFSVDNKNWVQMFFHNEGNGATVEYRTFDITEAYLEQVAAHPSDMLYIRMKNSVPGTGYGARLDKKPVALVASYGVKEISGDFITLDWSVGTDRDNGVDQDLYLKSKPSFNNGWYADGNGVGLMVYPLTNVDLSSEILFTMTACQQMRFEVSLDGTHYVEAFRYNNTGAVEVTASDSTGYKAIERTYDLTDAIIEAGKEATSKNNLYIRWGDSHPEKGWGGRILGNTRVVLNVRSAEGIEYRHNVRTDVITGPIALKADNSGYAFTAVPALPWADYRGGQTWHTINNSNKSVDASGATPILLGDVNGGNKANYYADGGYYVLRYELPEGANKWEFTATLGNQIGIYVAYGDSTTPHPETDAARYTKLTDYLAMGLTGSGDYKVSYTVSDTATEEELENGRYVYLLFTDDDWYINKLAGDTSGAGRGWGGGIMLGKNYPIAFNVLLSTEDELLNTTSVAFEAYEHTKTESFQLTRVQKVHNKDVYEFIENEPVLVGSAPISRDLPESRVFTDENGFLYTTGDGNWNGRYTDGTQCIYRYEIPEYATKFDWKVRMGGDYGIYIMYADEAPAAASEDWILVKDYLKDGFKIGEHPGVTNMTISQNIPADNTAKYVYIMFCDYDYRLDPKQETSGYGARIPMGSDYSVDMVWTLAGKLRDTIPSVKSAALSLTDNFNLNFKLNLPISSKGNETVTIAWADGTAVNYEKVDGGYLVTDILPQDMTKELVVNFSGTCMDNTQYTSKTFTYSVKDYCRRMIANYQDNAALVKLLSDALAYGAAAQAYVFDDGELATDGVVGMNVSTFEMPTGDYTKVLSDAANKSGDNYKWAGVTLVLDNTVAIRYTIYSYDGTAPVVNVEGKAVELVNDGNGYFHVDVPVMAGNFAKTYTASFEAIEGSSVTYSVNHYVARRYNANTLVTGDLIAALYNYGASAAAYVATQAN